MIVPANEMPKVDDIRDPADAPQPNPRLHKANDHSNPLKEGELIICRGAPSDKDWYLAEVWKVLPQQIEVKYFSTCTPPLEAYTTKSPGARKARLAQAHFRRTWFFRAGANAGKGTVKPPFPNNEDLRVWSGFLPSTEHDRVIYLRGVGLSGAGKLSRATLELASNLPIPHAATPAVEDETDTPAPGVYLALGGRQLFEFNMAYCQPCAQ